MRRRRLLGSGAALLASAAAASPAGAASADWASRFGYPTGVGPDGWNDKAYRIGNYSGGFEKFLRATPIRAGQQAVPLEPVATAVSPELERATWLADGYAEKVPCTGLLVVRRGVVLHERYAFGRTAESRLTSWSMAKSVTSLLLGACLDRGLVTSLDDPAGRYVPRLRGRLHGEVSLRHLANMSSGAAILHDRDNSSIYPRAFLGARSDLEDVVAGWNEREGPAGARYNYNELCPLTIGMVIREASGKSLAAFCEEVLWRPMGSEADASWLCDSRGKEFNCIGFGARLRDWARLGRLLVQRGRVGGQEVVSADWIRQCSSWDAADAQVRHNVAMPGGGYKFFFWHPRSNGTLLTMVGAYGQRLYADLNTQTVLVHTAVDWERSWDPHLSQVWNAFNAVKL